MSIFLDAAVAAFESVEDIAGEDVLFTCDLGELPIVAVPGTSIFEQDEESGLVRWESKDFLLRACQLKFDTVDRYEPKRGDTLTFDGRVYQALSDEGVPCFKYMGTGHSLMRIHTKHTADEAET